MNLTLILMLSQIVLSLVIIVLVLFQSKGKGLSPAISGVGMYRTKRGLEKLIFILTIVFSVALVINSIAFFVLK
ncbi:MAG: preprotein translocase subunit SecG [Patescibacteria group bacterium]